MNFDITKFAPWNWFKKEQQEAQQNAGSLPVNRSQASSTPSGTQVGDPLIQLHREVDRLFEDAFRSFGFGFPRLNPTRETASLLPTWQGMLRPSVDIQETDKQYLITLEVPGVDEKDIQLTLDDDVLWVRGEKRQEEERKDGQYHFVERSYGSFQRALNLPSNANQDAIKASFKNGVLTITLDKREQPVGSGARQIPIQN